MKFEAIKNTLDRIPFGNPVLIYENKSGTPYVGIAVLDKIDKDGCHWSNIDSDIPLDFMHVWGKISDFSRVNPTHWSPIYIDNYK